MPAERGEMLAVTRARDLAQACNAFQSMLVSINKYGQDTMEIERIHELWFEYMDGLTEIIEEC